MDDYLFSSRAKPVRLGLVGGGPGSFAGVAHPIAARLDGRISIEAGVFSSDAANSRDRAHIHGVVPDRAYGSVPEMLAAERLREDGIEAVAIITPRESHFIPAKQVLEAGLHVICEKPITESSDQARELAKLAETSGAIFCLTHNYSGYPMVREARQMVQDGKLGAIRMLQAEFTLGLAAARDESAADRKPWAFDLARQGYSWILLEVGTHAEHLARYVTGLRPVEVSAEIGAASPLFPNDDTAMLLVRYDNGARGIMWFTFSAAGGVHGLKLRVHGQTGGLEWRHEQPEYLDFVQTDLPKQTLVRGEPGLSSLSHMAERITRGHPEGFHEAFANLYRDFAEAIIARRNGTALRPEFATFPTIQDGELTLNFCEAAFKSATNDGAWTPVGCTFLD